MGEERTPEEIKQLEKMGKELIELRRLLFYIFIHRYGLIEADAEDVYQEVCVYMLEKGIRHLDPNQTYVPAIKVTAHRRALNYIRDNKRIDTHQYHLLEERDHLKGHDPTADLDACLDVVAIHKALLDHKPVRGRACFHSLAKHYFDEDLNIREVARKYRHNANTMHSAKRLMRKLMRSWYE